MMEQLLLWNLSKQRLQVMLQILVMQLQQEEVLVLVLTLSLTELGTQILRYVPPVLAVFRTLRMASRLC